MSITTTITTWFRLTGGTIEQKPVRVRFDSAYEQRVQQMLRDVGCPEVATIDQAAEALSKIHWSASPAQEKQFLLEELPHGVERITLAGLATLLIAAHHGD